MRTFYGVKRLTRSDLSFFRHHYGVETTHQKSINLNSDVFLPMFPGLDRGTFHSVDLHLIGPVDAPEERLQRKVVRSPSSKNWRLDGEFVVDPEEVPDRYHRLAEGDFAILKFEGDEQPAAIRCLLVSLVDTPQRHEAVDALLARDGSATLSMRLVTRGDLLTLAPAFGATGPSLAFLLDDAVKEALELGGGPIERPKRGRVYAGIGPAVDPADADAFNTTLSETGHRGEALIAGMLDGQRDAGALKDYRWVSLTHAYASFDFEIVANDGTHLEIEVKTTVNDYEQPIFISIAEAARLVERRDSYSLHRVFGLTETGAWVTVVDGLAEALALALDELDGLPPGIGVRGFSVDLGVLGNRGELQWLDDSNSTDGGVG